MQTAKGAHVQININALKADLCSESHNNLSNEKGNISIVMVIF